MGQQLVDAAACDLDLRRGSVFDAVRRSRPHLLPRVAGQMRMLVAQQGDNLAHPRENEDSAAAVRCALWCLLKFGEKRARNVEVALLNVGATDRHAVVTEALEVLNAACNPTLLKTDSEQQRHDGLPEAPFLRELTIGFDASYARLNALYEASAG